MNIEFWWSVDSQTLFDFWNASILALSLQNFTLKATETWRISYLAMHKSNMFSNIENKSELLFLSASSCPGRFWFLSSCLLLKSGQAINTVGEKSQRSEDSFVYLWSPSTSQFSAPVAVCPFHRRDLNLIWFLSLILNCIHPIEEWILQLDFIQL